MSADRILRYLLAFALTGLVTIANALLVRYTGYWTTALIYLLLVMGFAFFNETGPVLLTAFLSAVCWNFIFIPPVRTFRIDRLEDALMFLVYFLAAISMGTLTSRLHSKERLISRREGNIKALYELSRDFSRHESSGDIHKEFAGFLKQRFGAASVVELSGEKVSEIPPNYSSYPLKSGETVLGQIYLESSREMTRDSEQNALLLNALNLYTLVLEREKLLEIKARTRLLEESENLSKILFHSISHEFRTPLTAITGAATGLLDQTINSLPGNNEILAREILEAGDRLNHLVENLLDMSRMETGKLKLRRQYQSLEDLLGIVLRKYRKELADRALTLDLPDDLPLFMADSTLLEQVFSNLIYNALIHTPKSARILISASADPEILTITIADEGPGIPPGELPRLFGKFIKQDTRGMGGLGLGLSICKGIVEAHGGKIVYTGERGKGASFRISLPVGKPGEQEGDHHG
jgi:two-component system sensor histidine kinase KdpD